MPVTNVNRVAKVRKHLTRRALVRHENRKFANLFFRTVSKGRTQSLSDQLSAQADADDGLVLSANNAVLLSMAEEEQ